MSRDPAGELSICSVSFKHSAEVRRNIALSKRLNAKTRMHWIVAENSPTDSLDRLTEHAGDVTVIPGAGGGHSPTYHHTIALGNAIGHATTRFILILDPDFFVIRNEWAMHMIRHMLSNKLSVLGVPWHPKLPDKYRYFPAVHCSLFDTERFPKGGIDFRPDYPDGTSDPAWPGGYDEDGDDNYFHVKLPARVLSKLPMLKARRRFYTDTGGRIFKRYARDPAFALSYETIDPVYDPSRYRKQFRWTTNIIEKLLPDELCYLPKHYRNTRAMAFLHKWVAEPIPDDWQEFIWNGLPFGFHMQKTHHSSTRPRLEELKMLDCILGSIPAAPS